MFATAERNWRSVPFDFFDFFNNQIEGQKSAYVLGSVVFYLFIYLFLEIIYLLNFLFVIFIDISRKSS